MGDRSSFIIAATLVVIIMILLLLLLQITTSFSVFTSSSVARNENADRHTLLSSLWSTESGTTTIQAFQGVPPPDISTWMRSSSKESYYGYGFNRVRVIGGDRDLVLQEEEDPSMLIRVNEDTTQSFEWLNRDEFWFLMETTVVPNDSQTWYQFWVGIDLGADTQVFIDDTLLFSTFTTSDDEYDDQVITGPTVYSTFSSLKTVRKNVYLEASRKYHFRVVYTKHSTLRRLNRDRSNVEIAREVLNSITQTKLELRYEPNPQQVKIYVYDLPAKYNDKIVEDNKKCENHMFAAEVHIHRQLLKSESRTMNPYAADLYYIPAYSSCKYLKRAFGVNPWFGQENLEHGVDYVKTKFPFWDRSMGRDHVTAVTYDFGACFEYKRDKAAKKGVVSKLSRMHILSSLADVSHPCFRPEIDVAIPVHVSPKTIHRLHQYRFDFDENRKWLAHFQGSVEWFDHDPEYSNGIRQRLELLYKNDPLFHIGRGKVSTYASDMRNSTFCLCPPGFAPWSPRMYEAAAAGCIPVILTDHVKLPFDGTTLNWKEFSVKIREKDVERVREILSSISMSRIRSKRKALRRVWTALSYYKFENGKDSAIDHLLLEMRIRFSRTTTFISSSSSNGGSVLTDEEWS